MGLILKKQHYQISIFPKYLEVPVRQHVTSCFLKPESKGTPQKKSSSKWEMQDIILFSQTVWVFTVHWKFREAGVEEHLIWITYPGIFPGIPGLSSYSSLEPFVAAQLLTPQGQWRAFCRTHFGRCWHSFPHLRPCLILVGWPAVWDCLGLRAILGCWTFSAKVVDRQGELGTLLISLLCLWLITSFSLDGLNLWP